MKIYVHIGLEKTGTTSVQQFLHKERESLVKHGILYPSTFGQTNHIKLSQSIINLKKKTPARKIFGIDSIESLNNFKEELKAAFMDEVDKSCPKKIIISSEQLSALVSSKEEVCELEGFFRNINPSFTYLLTVRNQEDIMQSMYSTMIKSGYTQDFKIKDSNLKLLKYNFSSLIDVFTSNSNADVKVSYFGKNKNGEFNNFLDEINMILPEEVQIPINFVTNKSLGKDELNFLKDINSFLPKYGADDIVLRKKIINYLGRQKSSEVFHMPTELRKLIYQRFIADNSIFYENYLKHKMPHNPFMRSY
jgi:hypothetical protein